ncbi:hypothetical protein SBRCBS47491_003024 [Sporothrix bragantina]|uniref:Uncharacterized protein n=1 Tax=Sporothrix bragantina TaxID=671064 RepID=A0ABP0BBN4_9PEZI
MSNTSPTGNVAASPAPAMGGDAISPSPAVPAPTPSAAATPAGSTPASRTTSHTNGAGRSSRRRGSKTGRRRKPQEFMMPDGRRVLVALPEDVAALRDKYAGVMREAENGDGEGAPQVEVVVHGSPEHKRFLEESQAHHRSLREALKTKYGADILDEWDRVTADFNHVSTELEQLADHSSSLGHNFSKFGYSATLRTFGGDEHGGGGHGSGHGSGAGSASNSRHASRANSIASGTTDDDDDDTGSGGDSDDGGKSGVPVWHNQGSGQIMQLFKRPVVKQYFHRGLLWRASEETSVQSFELFFDLLYVGIIAVNGDHAAESADGFELLRFLVTFCLSWKIWSDVTQLVSWFSTNDVLQRFEILFLFSCLLGVTVNMVQTFYGWGSTGEAGSSETTTTSGGVITAERSLLFWRETTEGGGGESESFLADTYPALAAYYVAARLFMALYCFVTGLLVPLVQGTMFCQTGLAVVGAALWIASIHLDMPVRLACVFVALAFDLFGGSIVVGLFRYAMGHSNTRLGRFLMTHVFDFYPAMNIEHKVERTNAFISLVLGYSVVGVLYQNTHGYGVNAFLGKAIMGLMQAFFFNWIYFDIDAENIHVHAIRRRPESAYIWQYSHLLFTLAFILSSAALTRFVVATDCPNASLDSLTEMYQERSSPELSLGLRLYYSTGLGISLFAMTIIALCHQHKIPPTARLPKWARMANRLVVAAIFCALPAAQGLSSLKVMSIATGLIGWVLMFEIYGQSCVGDRLFETGETGGYTARCSQKRLRRALRDAQRELNGDEEGGSAEPHVDVNVLSQGQKHGAIYME